jgi:hypothetical protein
MRYYVMTSLGNFVTDRNAWERNSFVDNRGYRTEAAAQACRTRLLNLKSSPFFANELKVVAHPISHLIMRDSQGRFRYS